MEPTHGKNGDDWEKASGYRDQARDLAQLKEKDTDRQLKEKDTDRGATRSVDWSAWMQISVTVSLLAVNLLLLLHAIWRPM